MNENLFPDLKKLWHEEPVNAEYTESSQLAIKKIEKAIFKIKLFVASEIFATVLVVSFLIYRIYTSQNWLNQIAYGIIVLLVLAVEALLIYWRKGLWRSPQLSVAENAKFHFSQARLKLRMAQFTILGGPLGLLLGFGISISEPTSSGVGFVKAGILLALIGAVMVLGFRARRKAQNEYHQAQIIYEHIMGDTANPRPRRPQEKA